MSTLTVFIGRFQPIHAGHQHVIDRALETSTFVLVLVGSANRSRSWKNPFTFQERAAFIKALYPQANVLVKPLNDTLYDDDAWQRNVEQIATETAATLNASSIALTGFDKDASSRYLNWFPTWKMAPVAPYKHNDTLLHATQYRERLFGTGCTQAFGTDQIIKDWIGRNMDIVSWLLEERNAVESYKAPVKKAQKELGFPITINAVDNVVLAKDHVLLVQRHKAPGQGLWALPGGHIDKGERSHQAALREMREETTLVLSKEAIKASAVFDHPDRSERGWIRTEAFLYCLDTLQDVSPDMVETRQAQWHKVDMLDPTNMFEDHHDIIMEMMKQTT